MPWLNSSPINCSEYKSQICVNTWGQINSTWCMGAGYEIGLNDTVMVLSVHQYSGSTLWVQRVFVISSHCSFWAYEPGAPLHTLITSLITLCESSLLGPWCLALGFYSVYSELTSPLCIDFGPKELIAVHLSGWFSELFPNHGQGSEGLYFLPGS